jgi:hypothetical protein
MRSFFRLLGALGLFALSLAFVAPAHATLYFACGEDLCFQAEGTGITVNSGNFRSGYARESLAASSAPAGNYWEAQDSINGSSGLGNFNFSMHYQTGNSGTSPGSVPFLLFIDSTGVQRLYLYYPTTTSLSIAKETAAGTSTVLATSTAPNCIGASSQVRHYIVDVTNYGNSTTGNVTVWENNDSGTLTQCMSYTGDIQTDSATVLTGFELQEAGNDYGSYFSELIVADSGTDLRQAALVTYAPAAVGNTDAWSCSGSTSYGSVNPTTINDTIGCYTPTNALLEEFGVGATPSGNYTVLGLGEYIRAEKSASGPQNIEADVRSGTTSTQSPDLAGLQTVFGTVSYIWATNPTTGVAWTTSDLGSVQIGDESQP